MPNKKAQKTANEVQTQVLRSVKNKQRRIARQKPAGKSSRNPAHVRALAKRRLKRIAKVLRSGVGKDRSDKLNARKEQLENFVEKPS